MKKILLGSVVAGMLCASLALAAPAITAYASFAPAAPTNFMLLTADDQATQAAPDATAPDQQAAPTTGDMNQGAMMQNQPENKDQAAPAPDDSTVHENDDHATQE